ncbi:MAG: helix-turn-helix domain-containing protein [Planctomycetota bacterium]|nr:helix-turn-helix domain-containing protein [Planctomycetota bacterium]
MRPPLMVRPLTDAEREHLEAGWRSSDAFRLRRCQILLASARGERVPQIARSLGCDEQTARNAIHAFQERGLASLTKGSSRAHTIHRAFDATGSERLRALLHQSPRTWGHPTSLWTLELAAEVSFAQGITTRRITAETVRATLARLRVRWQRAKHWLTSPDPEYARKKGRATV